MFSTSKIEKAFCPKVEEIEESLDENNGGFSQCKKFNEFYFPTLFKVGKFGFLDCSTITYLSLEKLETVGKYSFCGCFLIKKLNLPNLKVVE
jgi:hypothetical protein